MIKWSFKLLKAWSTKYNIVVFIQTYPDIKKDNLGKRAFAFLNETIKSYALLNNFRLIDQNTRGIEWKSYATKWHVTTEGHRFMKEEIKKQLLVFLEQPPHLK